MTIGLLVSLMARTLFVITVLSNIQAVGASAQADANAHAAAAGKQQQAAANAKAAAAGKAADTRISISSPVPKFTSDGFKKFADALLQETPTVTCLFNEKTKESIVTLKFRDGFSRTNTVHIDANSKIGFMTKEDRLVVRLTDTNFTTDHNSLLTKLASKILRVTSQAIIDNYGLVALVLPRQSEFTELLCCPCNKLNMCLNKAHLCDPSIAFNECVNGQSFCFLLDVYDTQKKFLGSAYCGSSFRRNYCCQIVPCGFITKVDPVHQDSEDAITRAALSYLEYRGCTETKVLTKKGK